LTCLTSEALDAIRHQMVPVISRAEVQCITD